MNIKWPNILLHIALAHKYCSKATSYNYSNYLLPFFFIFAVKSWYILLVIKKNMSLFLVLPNHNYSRIFFVSQF